MPKLFLFEIIYQLNLTFRQHIWAGKLLILVCLATGLHSCKITRHVPDGQHLLKKNTTKGISDTKLKEGAELAIKHKPNRRILGFLKFYLAAYNIGADGKTPKKKWRLYFMDKIGEAPVIYDSSKMYNSADFMRNYLFNQGYFDARVRPTTKTRRKKVSVTYHVEMGEPYYINKVDYAIPDRLLYRIIINDSSERLFKTGDQYSASILTDERNRITSQLREMGYYKFNKEYIVYDLDTALTGNLLNVNISLRNPTLFTRHERYVTGSVLVEVRNSLLDTLVRKEGIDFRGKDVYQIDGKKIYLAGLKINPEIVARAVLLDSGQFFKQSEVEGTIKNVTALQVFKSITIDVKEDTLNRTLHYHIYLIPQKKQEIILEPQAISSEQSNAIRTSNIRNYGLAGSLLYRNKNFLKNAEVLEIRARSSFEGQFANDTVQLFNIQEHSLTANIYLQKLLLFKRFERDKDASLSRSSFNAGYIYETNIDFARDIFSVGYTESFIRKLYNINITPLEISYNQTFPKRDFLSLVSPQDSIFIANLFTTNFIPNTRITFVYSDKPLTKTGTNFFYRFSIESSGNTLNAFMKLTNQPLPADGRYKINNVAYEQYLKVDNDLRYNYVIDQDQAMAYRLHFGIGHAYGNSEIVPFVRRYFIGGANSLRGWRPRTMGPGSYNTQGFRADHTGEMILEAQMEYRFMLINKLLYGALFTDAGNVWYTEAQPGRTGANFRADNFYKELAWDCGFGFRFDFNFFVFRFDFGLPLHQPDLPEDERWLTKKYYSFRNAWRATVVNLGVGYPF